MSGSFGDPLAFLVRTLFELVIFIVLLRYFLQAFRANFFNPMVQTLVKITDPVLKPLRQYLPRMGRHDLATLLVAGILIVLMVWVLGMMRGGMPVLTLVLMSIYFAFLLVTDLFFWTILMRAIASWVGNNRSPGVALLEDLTDPLLQPVQKFLPPLGGFDLSPLAVLIVIQVLQMAVGNVLLG